MPDLLHILLRIVAGIAGALLLYIAFFLYADEEARLQNRLEQIWKWIDALQKAAMSREVAFLQGTAGATRMGLDRLLGHKLLSVRSVAISLALSFGSFLAILASRNPHPHPDDKFLLGFCALVMLVLGILPALAFSGHSEGRDSYSTTSHKSYYFGMICAEVLLPWIAVWRPRLWALWVVVPWGLIHPERPRVIAFHYLVRTELVIVLGVVSDALFIVFFRSTLSQIENVSNASENRV